MKKALSVGVCSLVFCSTIYIDLTIAKTVADEEIIDTAQKFFTPLLQAFGEKKQVKETIATVNGYPITLDDIFVVYSAGTFSTNLSLPQSVEAVREDFSLILQELITDELIRQDLAKHGILSTDMDMQRAEQEARAPFVIQDELERAKMRQSADVIYTQDAEKQNYLESIKSIDSFTDSLMERGLSLAQWRTMLARQVHRDAFMEHILEPTIHVNSEDLEEAYRAYPELAHVEKRVQYRLFSVDSLDTATQLRQALNSGTDAQLPVISGYIVEDFLMPYDRIPENLKPVVEHVEKSFACDSEDMHYAEIIEENDEISVICILKILPEHVLTLEEAHVRLERLLMEQERAKAFDYWLEQAWQSADIYLSPQLSLLNFHHKESEIVQESLVK